jgi:hypothetical protein
LHNKRLTKTLLKRNLTQRYNSRLAAKLCALFDWSVAMDYQNFYRQLDQVIINSGTLFPNSSDP